MYANPLNVRVNGVKWKESSFYYPANTIYNVADAANCFINDDNEENNDEE